MALRDSILKSWQQPNALTLFLWPLSLIYRLLFFIRKKCYQWGIFSSYRASVPVVIVGNLTVGGTGKTPLVIHVIELLRRHGYNPGVISRGYSGQANAYPLEVTLKTPVNESGDEPALIVKRTGVPMFVGPVRGDNIDALLAKHSVDVIISDDGLQHLALQRDIELCLIDDTSPLNNPYLLPAGPFRENLKRLQSIDMIIHHQQEPGPLSEGHFSMQLTPGEIKPLLHSNTNVFQSNEKIHAVAGIGNPQRFFNTCNTLGLDITPHSFADHHHFSADDLQFDDSLSVLMTEKDAVKCLKFATDKLWYLPVDAKLGDGFADALLKKLNLINQTTPIQ